MKIGFITDTHDRQEILMKAIEIFAEQDVVYVLHAGDITSPATAEATDTMWIDSQQFSLKMTEGQANLAQGDLKPEAVCNSPFCKSLCRKSDWLDPERMPGPLHHLQREAPASGSLDIHRVLQQLPDASVARSKFTSTSCNAAAFAG